MSDIARLEAKLSDIIARLERIEARQITVKGEIESAASTQPQGSFATGQRETDETEKLL